MLIEILEFIFNVIISGIFVGIVTNFIWEHIKQSKSNSKRKEEHPTVEDDLQVHQEKTNSNNNEHKNNVFLDLILPLALMVLIPSAIIIFFASQLYRWLIIYIPIPYITLGISVWMPCGFIMAIICPMFYVSEEKSLIKGMFTGALSGSVLGVPTGIAKAMYKISNIGVTVFFTLFSFLFLLLIFWFIILKNIDRL